MNQNLRHDEILDSLWGNDIAKFPAHLATINLAINDLSIDKNYPNILQEDFFELHVGSDGFTPDNWRKRRAKTLGIIERDILYPRWFDCLVGNPPYTRQEEISDISPDDAKYKESLIQKALFDLNGNSKLAEIGKRAGIYAYFFIHGIKFLKEGGFFGFIVSNAWLDVDYGKGLQEFFLKNYKIITIIESKVERWFEDADINTCIVILQKSSHEEERDNNLARFSYLKKPLRYFIPSAQDTWETQKQRIDAIDRLKKTILAHNEYYENDDLRIFPILQKHLWEEGYDTEKKEYVGGKWGKYIRAPRIYFTILEKAKDILVPMKEVAKVRFGIKTGANEFFYLTEEEIERRGIEREFWMHQDESGNWVPNYVIKSPRECTSLQILPEELKYRVLMIHKEKKSLRKMNVLKYIKDGERNGFHERPTCSNRALWYDLGEEIRDTIAFPERIRKNYIIFFNTKKAYLNKNLYGIEPYEGNLSKAIALILNSTVFSLFIEVTARQPGGGGGPLDIDVYNVQDLLFFRETIIKEINPKIQFNSLIERKIVSIFDEINTKSPDEVSLDTIRPDRRELDKIIMGDILGLTEEEQLDVYRAVIDLVQSRIEKAKSVQNNQKTKEGINIESFVDTVISAIGDANLGNFYKFRILIMTSLTTKTLPVRKNSVEIIHDFFGIRIKTGNEYIDCISEEEARYLKIFIEIGLNEVKIPIDKQVLDSIIPELEKVKEENDTIINSYLDSIISKKTKKILMNRIYSEIMN